MIGHAFQTKEGLVALLFYQPTTHVQPAWGDTLAEVMENHDVSWADRDQQKWGRAILEGRQGGHQLYDSAECDHQPRAQHVPLCVECMQEADVLENAV